jgi:hypothetical protein
MAKKQRCEIELVQNGTLKALSFNAQIPDTLLCDMFMSTFSPLGLAGHEKREMSLKDRENLCRFKNLDHEDIKRHAHKLLKTITKIKPGTQVHINAKDVAAYVCLAAIFSGDMPDHIELTFELAEVPIKLFPETLVAAKMPTNVDVTFASPQESWLGRFQSICEIPPHLSQSRKVGRRLRTAA